MKEKLIKNYINSLTIDDIQNFSLKNNIVMSNEEYEYIYQLIKKNWHTLIFGNPNSIFQDLKSKLSSDKYHKLVRLYQTYKSKYRHYL